MGETDEAEVPMAWFWAESVAEDLILRMDSPAPLNPFGFRATHNVLSLTMLLSGIARCAHDLAVGQLEVIRDLVSMGGTWVDWCDSRLSDADAPAPCLALAQRAWRWLLLTSPPSEWQLPPNRGAGCKVGLMHARRAVNAQLSRRLG
jgi:hypothetical protein